jgi:hypothetical protein
MPYESIETKKFLDSDGTGYLWTKIKQRYDSKLDSVAAKDDSILVSDSKDIKVQISAEAGNLLQLKTTGNKGLYVQAAASPDNYAIVKASDSGPYAAIYQLMKYPNGSQVGTKVGVDINIPKDMVVQSGTVETKATSGTWGEPGTYIHLVLANASNSDLYISVGSLIEYVTSGSQLTDMVVISIDSNTHQVTASLTDDSIPATKLTPAVRAQLSAGATAIQSVSEGSTNGTISVDGTDVAVHGLASAAYAPASTFDLAGSADNVLGTDSDTAATVTVYGVKKYASDAYAAIQALTTTEIDNAIAAANIVDNEPASQDDG